MNRTRTERLETALIGAFVADAAALGFHWLYDPDRIAALAGDEPAFRTPDPADFDGYRGVFVHPGKQAGDLSQYGVQLQIAVAAMLDSGGRFDRTGFQDRFAATFGPGGAWVGYMDKATKGTLDNLRHDRRDPSGADDDQVPAIAKLPAVMAAPDIDTATVEAAIATTNANETARIWSRPCAELLRAAYNGTSIAGAIDAAIHCADPAIADSLRAARDADQPDSTLYAGEIGRACPLPQALPVMVHIAARSGSYREAVERNILAGGDNCGRAPVLGALFGAAYGAGGAGIPIRWIGALTQARTLTRQSAALAALVSG